MVINIAKTLLFEEAKLKPTLIFAYGNFDREDDGVAWHIAKMLAQKYGQDFPDSPEDEFPLPGPYPHIRFDLQLLPELAEELVNYERVVFIDAHTGAVPDDLNIQELSPSFQNSPLTHHMTPQTVLEIAKTLYNAQPQALLVSVRGYQFGFSRELSAQTAELAAQAVMKIEVWLDH